MKRDAFVAGGLRIETSRDWDGRWYVAWKPDASMYFRDRKQLLKFCAWPPKTPTGDALRSWLSSMEQMDAERVSGKVEPLTSEPLVEGSGSNLSQELLATGFGPECHIDESDPNFQTRTVI